MSDIIASDVQGHYIDSALISLFEIEVQGTYVFFHSGLDETLEEVQFVSRDTTTINTYQALPIVIDGIEIQADGAQSRPSITMANVTSVFRDALGGLRNDDLIGKTIVCRQTFRKFLVGGSEENTVGNEPNEFPVREYIIDRIAQETKLLVRFELASPFDLEGIQLPRRVIVGKYCSWAYQGYYSETSYGACTWKRNGKTEIVGANNNLYTNYFYFNEDNQPLISETWAADENNILAWSSATTYTPRSYVKHSGSYWLSLAEDNINEEPSSSSVYWRQSFSYTPFAAGTSYSKNDYVIYGEAGLETVWRCFVAHTGTEDYPPVAKSKYWTRGDVCSKALAGCKARFQAVPVDEVSSNSPPSGYTNTSHAMPFGAFPGSARFK